MINLDVVRSGAAPAEDRRGSRNATNGFAPTPKWRANASLSWSKGIQSASATVRFIDRYGNDQNASPTFGIPEIDSFTTVDVHYQKLFWFNLILTATVMVAVILQLLPLAVVFMTGFAVALLVNYRSVKGQREALHAHAVNVVNVAVLLFAAAVFTGILSGSGMVDAMARTIVWPSRM